MKISISFIFLSIISSLFYHQILRGKYYSDLCKKNYIRILPLKAKRGAILDRNKDPLAKDQISFDVCISPVDLKEKEFVFRNLSQILGIDQKKIEYNYKKRYIAPFYRVVVARDINKETLISLEEKRIFLPQVIIQRNYKRIYPKEIASHIIGYLGIINQESLYRLKDYGYKFGDMIGYSGVEEYSDIYLRGKEGGNLIEVDNKGRVKRLLGFKEPENGKDLELTIDSEIQKICEEVLEGKRGAIIFMNPNNGEIFSLVSSPGFDPNIFIDEERIRERDRLLRDKTSPLLNRAISGLYPLGSVFKLVVATSSLEENLISPKKRFYCKGKTTIGNRDFRCWTEHSDENLVEAITHSCNSYFFQLGLLIGPKLISQYALKLGLGRKTGIELPYESKGSVPSSILKRWFPGDTANLAIGQGELLTTPLQAISLINLFANGGKLVIPHIFKRDYPIKSIGLKDKTISVIREGLLRTVEDPVGTAHILKIKGISIAGKTGTAQTSTGAAHGWFVGFLPFKNPKYSFCILLENCGSSQYATALAKEILEKMRARGLL